MVNFLAPVPENDFITMQWIIDAMTVMAVIIILYHSSILASQKFSFYMILILSTSCFIRPVMNLLMLIPSVSYNTILGALTYGVIQFSLFWTAFIAIFVYLITNRREHFNAKVYMMIAILICFLCALIFLILIVFKVSGINAKFYGAEIFAIEYDGDETADFIGYLLIVNIWGKFLPILTNCFCFYKVYRCFQINGLPKPSRVLLYPLIQIVCILPHAFFDFFPGALRSRTVTSFAVTIVEYIEGPLYLFVYWYLTPTKKNSSAPPRLLENVTMVNLDKSKNTTSSCNNLPV